MNKLDKQYQELLQDILDNGVTKSDRTGTGTISVFGRQIRHKMSEGFPLLTTKKMPFKTITTELLWFLRGDTNIKFLVDNNCHIWDGDAHKNYLKNFTPPECPPNLDVQPDYDEPMSKDMFIYGIKTDDEFAKKWGELGPIYGRQWRNWNAIFDGGVDQIANLINDLKTNPDSRRLMVNAWNVGELDQMVLPPCHYGFQVYTRELSFDERMSLLKKLEILQERRLDNATQETVSKLADSYSIPTRAISLMWNQRSVDTFLGLPFNIASYGLLLEIIAKAVNMVPDELIGNLGDVHLYSNHVDQAREQIGRKYTPEERELMLKDAMSWRLYNKAVNELMPFGGGMSEYYDMHKIPHFTREPHALPKLNINTEFWLTESGECGIGSIKTDWFTGAFSNESFCKCLLEEDIQLADYVSHPAIKATLSN